MRLQRLPDVQAYRLSAADARAHRQSVRCARFGISADSCSHGIFIHSSDKSHTTLSNFFAQPGALVVTAEQVAAFELSIAKFDAPRPSALADPGIRAIRRGSSASEQSFGSSQTWSSGAGQSSGNASDSDSSHDI